jgi:uncharacterized membrane protein
MKPKNLYRIMIGVLMVISGIISIIMTVGNPIVGTILVCAGLAFLFTGIVRHRKFGDDPESDERSKKIGAYGLSYAWLTGLFFMVALLWLDNLGLLKLSTNNALSCSILVLTISAVIYQAYLFRKGDVD